MARLVLDSNFLISALFWDGNERRLLNKCIDGEHTPVLSIPIIKEVEKVLKDKFDVPGGKLDEYIRSLVMMSDMVFVSDRLEGIQDDPKDDMVVETAVTGNADYIVTGDRHLLKLCEYGNIVICNTSGLLDSK